MRREQTTKVTRVSGRLMIRLRMSSYFPNFRRAVPEIVRQRLAVPSKVLWRQRARGARSVVHKKPILPPCIGRPPTAASEAFPETKPDRSHILIDTAEHTVTLRQMSIIAEGSCALSEFAAPGDSCALTHRTGCKEAKRLHLPSYSVQISFASSGHTQSSQELHLHQHWAAKVCTSLEAL